MLGPELRFTSRTKAVFQGRELVFFGGNDYHRLSRHPEVIEAFSAAAARDGLSSAGSRTTTGNHPLYVELEARASRFLGAESAAVFASGYLANLILLQAVSGEFHRFFIDASAHSSITDAIAAEPRGVLHRFEHAQADDLERQLGAHLLPGEKPLVLTDGVFASSGEVPPLRKYCWLAAARGGKVLIDDAHGIAVLGKAGKGCPEELGLPQESYFQTGTLSKGLGASGGVIAGSTELIERIHSRSMAFVGSTGMPVPAAAAGIRAIEILEREPVLISILRERSLRIKRKLRDLGFPVSLSPAPIASVSCFDAEKNRKLHGLLLEAGIYPPLINYPGSPPGGHFRFTFSSAHGEEEIEKLLAVLEESRRVVCGREPARNESTKETP